MIKNLNGLDSFAVVFVYVMVLNVRTCDIFYVKKVLQIYNGQE
jgi:hypothetical protein